MNRFKLIKKLKNVYSVKIYKDSIYCRLEKENLCLCEISKNTFEIQWKSHGKTLDYLVNDKFIIFNIKEDSTYIVKRDSKELYYKIPTMVGFDSDCISSKIFMGGSYNDVVIFDIETKEYKTYKKEKDLSPWLVIDDKILCKGGNKAKLSLYTGLFELLWEFDISQFGIYREYDYIRKRWEECRRTIDRIYYYHDKIIVTISRAVIALNPDNGELLWKIDFEYDPVKIIFDGNRGYNGYLIHYAVIDVDKGELIYEKEYDPAYRFEVEGIKLSQIVYNRLTLHNGYLWDVHCEKGYEFLLKMKPDTGEILEGMKLDSNSSVSPVKFDEKRMYVNNNDGDLFIYEMVEGEAVATEEDEVFTQVLDISGSKHILIYTESWNRTLEEKLESFFIRYWVNGQLTRADDVLFVFKATVEINEESLYEEMMKFLNCERVRGILSALPEENVKALTGEVVHPEYQPYYMVEFFKQKENFQKVFRVKG